MTALENIVSPETIHRLGWTLLHFVWQAAAVALVLAIVLRLLQKSSANVRYIIACLALALIVLLPAITFHLVNAPDLGSHGESVPIAVSPPTENLHELADPPQADRSNAQQSARGGLPPISWTQRARNLFTPALPYVVFGWLAGVFALSVWHLGGWAQLQRLRRKMVKQVDVSLQSKLNELAEALSVNRAVQLLESALVQVPTVVGWLRPVILLPASALTGLSTDQLEAMLAHELAHIKRFDYLVNMLQTAVEILGFYHPALWWVSHKIRAERENCCDDLAVSILGDRVCYARALTSMEEIRASQPELAIAASGGSLLARVRRLVGKESTTYSRDGWLPSAIAIVLILALAIPTTFALTTRPETEAAAERKEEPTKSLQQAAADGDIEQVKLNLSQGADINAKDNTGRTALHRATYEGHADVVRLLIDRGADVNARNRSQRTPLHSAAMKGDKKSIELLLSKGADISAKDRRGSTPLFVAMTSTWPARKEVAELLVAKGAKIPAFHLAAYMGDMEKLEKCLEEGINVNTPGDSNSTALHLVANSGKKDIVEFLISKGAQVDVKDVFDWTPLLYAASHNYEDIADLLLAKGADVNAKDEDGYTLLYHAIWDEDKDAVKLLISKGADVNVKDHDGYTQLVWAIWMDNKDIVELVINKGADVNAEDKDGYTPLYYAAMQDSKDLVELLTAKGATAVSSIHLAAGAGDLDKVKKFIEQGTHVDAKDKAGLTALQWAIMQDHKDVAAFLIDKGADINVRDKRGQTPLHQACSRGRKDMAEFLIAKGAHVNLKDKDGQTPLHLAANRGHKEILELLIDNGAEIDIRENRWSSSALLNAAVRGQKEAVELLLQKGADIEVRNGDGLTPLHLTAGYGSTIHTDVIQLLLEKGAEIETRGHVDCTPLQTAVAVGRKEVAELLLAHGAKLNVTSKYFGTPAHHAMKDNHRDAVRWAISKGIDIPPMHQAAYFGEADKVRSLLGKGADVNHKDIAKFTPLHCAVLGRNKEIVQLLIDNGADLGARSCGDITPLFCACRGGYLDIVTLLVNSGAEVNSSGWMNMKWGPGLVDKWTNLHITSFNGHIDVVEYLLDKGADIHAKFTWVDEGLTALHLAAKRGHAKVVEHLLAKGADVNAKTKKGGTALSLAKEKGHKQVVELLLKHGAKD